MAGRSARVRTSLDNDSTMRTPERQRRSFSQSEDTPRPAAMFHGPVTLNPSLSQDSTTTTSSTSEHQSQHPTKRLGFLGEMLLSSTSSSSASTLRGSSSNQIPAPRSHSRADSANLLRDQAASPTPSAMSHIKGHPSPSKIVSREMHRLGNLAHLPGLNPSISAPSTVALTVSAQPSTMSVSAAGGETPWPSLHQHILPLFNGESLRVPIEDLNALVRRHIQTVVSSTPSKALAILEHDTTELITNGMVTLSTKLNGAGSDNIVPATVSIWEFFWGSVLPYVEGALLPLQTDPLLSSLYRIPKGKPTSPVTGTQTGKSSATSTFKTPQIDVRTIALQSFRDHIIYPVSPVLHERLVVMREQSPGGVNHPKLQQMLLVLVSQRSLPLMYSLTGPPPPPPPGEEAVTLLLRDIRTPLLPLHPTQDSGARKSAFAGTGAPSFLSGGLPRDRRGRIARKPEKSVLHNARQAGDIDVDGTGGETPRVGAAYPGDRDMEREFLESLRSPEPNVANPRASVGGWGLGDGLGVVGDDSLRTEMDDEYENGENLDWDKTQAVVERMVGMKT